MKATNRDLLLFSNAPIIKNKKPGFKHELRVLPPSKSRKYAKYFTLAREYDGGKDAFSKGWLYAFVGGKKASGFISIAFDGSNSYLFNEIRFKGKTIGIEEGLCKVRFDQEQGRAIVKDARKQLVWSGKGPEYEVVFTMRDGPNELKLTYSFSRIRRDIGYYKCIFEQYGSILADWFLAPMHGKLLIESKGDLAKLGYADLKPLVGEPLESNFGYTECVHANLPFLRAGWQWSVLACQRDPGELQPEKFVGFFDFFIGNLFNCIPLNFQFYTVDVATGEFNVFSEAEMLVEKVEGIPRIKVTNAEGSVKLLIQSASEGKRHSIKGKRLARFLKTADIDYRGYPSVGTAIIDGKEYKAIGTSEFAGTGEGYWI